MSTLLEDLTAFAHKADASVLPQVADLPAIVVGLVHRIDLGAEGFAALVEKDAQGVTDQVSTASTEQAATSPVTTGTGQAAPTAVQTAPVPAAAPQAPSPEAPAQAAAFDPSQMSDADIAALVSGLQATLSARHGTAHQTTVADDTPITEPATVADTPPSDAKEA